MMKRRRYDLEGRGVWGSLAAVRCGEAGGARSLGFCKFGGWGQNGTLGWLDLAIVLSFLPMMRPEYGGESRRFIGFSIRFAEVLMGVMNDFLIGKTRWIWG